MIVGVNATALTSGGAFTILKQFLEVCKDKKNCTFHIFVDVSVIIPTYENVIIHRVKYKSWIRRIYWDWHGFNNYISDNNLFFNKVMSLQNTTINIDSPQLVYLHQPLPFSDKKWNLWNKDEFVFYLYKKFYTFFIFKFMKDDTVFFVQTEWIKNKLLELKPELKNRVVISKPEIYLPSLDLSNDSDLISSNNNEISFFYPSSSVIYKNHMVLAKALVYLKNTINYDLSKIKVYLTINKGDIPKLDSYILGESIESCFIYLGQIPYEEVIKCYKKTSALVFPSYIETFGLPLLEAAFFGKKIIASDVSYSREVLLGYDNVDYCTYNDPAQWAIAIQNAVHSKCDVFELKINNFSEATGHSASDGWVNVFKFFEVDNV